jgi:hypothetical protein
MRSPKVISAADPIDLAPHQHAHLLDPNTKALLTAG